MLLFYPNSVVTIYFDIKNSLSHMLHDYPLSLKILNRVMSASRRVLQHSPDKSRESCWTRSWRTTLHCHWTSSCRSSTPYAPRPVGGLVARRWGFGIVGGEFGVEAAADIWPALVRED